MICQWFSLLTQITSWVTKNSLFTVTYAFIYIYFIYCWLCLYTAFLYSVLPEGTGFLYFQSWMIIISWLNVIIFSFQVSFIYMFYFSCNSPLYYEGKCSFMGNTRKHTVYVYNWKLIFQLLWWYCNIHWNMISNQDVDLPSFQPHIHIIMEQQNVIIS